MFKSLTRTNQETRRSQLRGAYYFECEYHMCSLSPQAIKASDVARLEMRTPWKDNENRFMSRYGIPAWSAQQIMNVAERLIEIHDKEHMQG